MTRLALAAAIALVLLAAFGLGWLGCALWRRRAARRGDGGHVERIGALAARLHATEIEAASALRRAEAAEAEAAAASAALAGAEAAARADAAAEHAAALREAKAELAAAMGALGDARREIAALRGPATAPSDPA